MNQAIKKLMSSPVEHLGQRVITLGMMDEAHERKKGTAGRAFREHREKLVEGQDYFTSNPTDEIRRLAGSPGGSGRAPILLTEQGYLLLVKSFHDDLARKVGGRSAPLRCRFPVIVAAHAASGRERWRGAPILSAAPLALSRRAR